MLTDKNKLTKYISIALFALLTFIIALLRAPFWDETRAVTISLLNFNEMIQVTRIDGHPIFWYLILKFFTNIKTYPYSMYFINWLLCVISLKILWDKAPFNNLTKIFITFSNIFIFYFAIVARGYTFVIAFLFLICALYNIRFKKPYIYAFLIGFCANLELVSAIFCFYLGLTFLYELYKRKRKKVLTCVFLIFLICSILLILQFYTPEDYNLTNIYDKGSLIRSFNYISTSYLRIFYNLIFILFTIIFSIILFKRNKKHFFITLGSLLTYASIFLTIYIGSFWNFHFFYIYFILFSWLNYKYISKTKILNILFYLILIYNLPFITSYMNNPLDMVYSSRSLRIASFISTEEHFKNVKLYSFNWWDRISPGADIYLAQRGIYLYDPTGLKRLSFGSIKNIYKYKEKDLEKLYNSFDKDRENYLLVDKSYIELTRQDMKNFYFEQFGYKEDLNLFILKLHKK